MRTTRPLAVLRAGLACPVGLTGPAAVAAMRAGITRFSTLPGSADVTLSRLSILDEAATGPERMLALARRASTEALRVLPRSRWSGALRVFAALPDQSTRETGLPLLAGLRQAVSTAAQRPVVLDARTVHDGRSGVFDALTAAETMLTRSADDLAVVLAADSLVDPRNVARLRGQHLLLGPRNPDGRIPGEAAACFVVARPGTVAPSDTLADVVAIARHEDSASFARVAAGEAATTGTGLTHVLHTLASRWASNVDIVVDGQPSETHWGRDFGYAYLRAAAVMPEPLRRISLGGELGDTGAAAGAVALHRALAELAHRPASPGAFCGSALAYATSDHGATGGAIVAR